MEEEEEECALPLDPERPFVSSPLAEAEVTSRESPVRPRPSLSPFWRSVHVHPRFGIDSDKVREEERTTILTGIHLDTVRIN